MIDTYYFNKRLFYIVSLNRNIEQEHFEEMKALVRKRIYITLSVSVTTLIVLFYYRQKGYFQFSGPTQAIQDIKAVYTIMGLSLFAGFIPGSFYYLKIANKLNEILTLSKEKNYFTPNELRLIHDEDYFNKVVIEPNSS